MMYQTGQFVFGSKLECCGVGEPVVSCDDPARVLACSLEEVPVDKSSLGPPSLLPLLLLPVNVSPAAKGDGFLDLTISAAAFCAPCCEYKKVYSEMNQSTQLHYSLCNHCTKSGCTYSCSEVFQCLKLRQSLCEFSVQCKHFLSLKQNSIIIIPKSPNHLIQESPWTCTYNIHTRTYLVVFQECPELFQAIEVTCIVVPQRLLLKVPEDILTKLLLQSIAVEPE